MGGTIADVNTQHTQDLYGTIKTQNTASAALKAWKNDKAISELVLFSKNCALENVTVTASALTNGTATIPAGNVTATFIKQRKLIMEAIWDMEAKTVQFLRQPLQTEVNHRIFSTRKAALWIFHTTAFSLYG